MNEPTPTDTPAPEASQFAKDAAHKLGCCSLLSLDHQFAEPATAEIIQEAIDESAKATPPPSLTGEEVSDEAKVVAELRAIKIGASLDWDTIAKFIIKRALSTARAQDKATADSLRADKLLLNDSITKLSGENEVLIANRNRLQAELESLKKTNAESV